MINAVNGTTVAGYSNGTSCSDSSCLWRPLGIDIDENENLYIADTGYHRVQYWANGATIGKTIAEVTS